jgi:hypothetical protein
MLHQHVAVIDERNDPDRTGVPHHGHFGPAAVRKGEIFGHEREMSAPEDFRAAMGLDFSESVGIAVHASQPLLL